MNIFLNICHIDFIDTLYESLVKFFIDTELMSRVILNQ